MTLVDAGREWDAVPDDRPCRVWSSSPGPRRASARRPRPPREVVLPVADVPAGDLGPRVPALVAAHDPRAGDRVTIDLGDARRTDLAGLGLLLQVTWRRVGPAGQVELTGGSAGLRAQLTSLGITPATARAGMYGGTRQPCGTLAAAAGRAAQAAPDARALTSRPRVNTATRRLRAA